MMFECPIACRAGGTRPLVVSVLLVLIVFSSGPVSWALEQLPVAKIVSVDLPPHVSRGENFTVVVSVDYSGSYGTDVAILDAPTGFVLASKGLVIPAGRNLFTFSLTARDYPGTWALLATVRVWWHSGWYGNPEGGTFPFEITISEPAIGILNIRSNLDSVVIKIDGISHAVPSKGLELSSARGFHTIEVECHITLGEGTRAVFDRWSDRVRSPAREVYLGDKLDLSAIYSTQYFLTVESNISQTVGTGWYPSGMNATIAALDPAMTEQTPAGPQVTYKFSHWSGDSESTSPVSWVVMDRPRRVVANWAEDTSQITLMYQLVIISLIFLSCSAALVAVGVTLRRRVRPKFHNPVLEGTNIVRALLLALFFLAAVAHSPAVEPASALAIVQSETVTIGDAVWYHWNQAASDTCLIWLGGGIVGESWFMVNPYEFESYNTVRFIQDLARYYDVLALKKGSMLSVDSTLNRTIFGEPYRAGSTDFMKKIRIWADEEGYTYLYVVGYSVGAMVAAEELILANPRHWVSPDGLIIITTKFPQAVSSASSSLRASLLLLYGDKIAPDFTASGELFFQNAPDEGWHENSWFHKEYHVISGVEHEVWTIRDSGEYDGRAVLLTVKFIETSKSLQFEQVKDSISRIALNFTASTEPHSPLNVEITSVKSPSRVRTGETFRIVAAARYYLSLNFTVAVVTFQTETGSIVSVAEKKLIGRGERQFAVTLVSGDNPGTSRFVFVPLFGSPDGWTIVSEGISSTFVTVSDSFTATVIIRYPSVPVQFDAESFRTGTFGEVTANATPGEHLITVPPVIMLGNASRAVFQQWNDTLSGPTLHLTLSGDLALLAIYRRQYYLNVTSPFGQTNGSGWYDENAVAQFHVTPPLLVDETTHVFAGWSGDSNDSSPASSVSMNGSKDIRASWRGLERGGEDVTLLQLQALLTLSSATLLGSLIFAGMSLHSRRKVMLTLASAHSA
mgnify:CR=1 FL=1